MSEPVVQSLLRLPISLKTKIEQAAKENNRSINSETIARLEKSFEGESEKRPDDIINTIREENAKLQESIAGILSGLTILKNQKRTVDDDE